MGVFAGSKICLTLVIGKVLSYIERINGCFIGAVMDCIYLFGFGALDYIEDHNTIIVVALVLSAFGGVG